MPIPVDLLFFLEGKVAHCFNIIVDLVAFCFKYTFLKNSWNQEITIIYFFEWHINNLCYLELPVKN